MYVISFSPYFVENAEQLSNELKIPIVYYLQPDYIYHVFSAHDAAKQLLDFQKEHSKTRYIIYQSENIDSHFFKDKNYIELMKRNTVYQYSPMIANHCLIKYHIELGSYFTWDYMPLVTKQERDLDLIFFGTMTPKRYQILTEIQKKFNIIPISQCFGKDMEDILLRTKYVLNISAYDNNALETHRINKALACGCKVISNPSCDEMMNKKYKDLIIFTEGRTITDYMMALEKIFHKEEKGNNGDCQRD
jgi:hypothetical protein